MSRLLAQVAAHDGWSVDRRRGGHWRVRARAGALLFVGALSKDHRSVRNARAALGALRPFQ